MKTVHPEIFQFWLIQSYDNIKLMPIMELKENNENCHSEPL